MLLEQGALSGKYNTQNPLLAGSQRGQTYNPMLPQIEVLTDAMKEIGIKYNVSVSQIGIAWAIAKGTTPIIGVNKPEQVEDAAKAAQINLTSEDMNKLEEIAASIGVDTRGSWEHPMV